MIILVFGIYLGIEMETETELVYMAVTSGESYPVVVYLLYFIMLYRSDFMLLQFYFWKLLHTK